MALTVTAASSLNNWNDELIIQNNLLRDVGDTLNNWSDAQLLRGDWSLNFGDNLNSWLDTLRSVYHRTLSASDSMTFSDAAVLILLAQNQVNASDSLNNWNDEAVLRGQSFLDLSDTLNRWNDNVTVVLEVLLSLADDLDSWDDSHLAVLLAGLVVSASDNLNNWDDAATSEFLSRLQLAKRSDLVPYIRRYLNDVLQPTTGEIHISVGDNLGHWGDSVG